MLLRVLACLLALLAPLLTPLTLPPPAAAVTAAAPAPTTVSLDGDGWRLKDYALDAGLAAGAADPATDDSGWLRATVPGTANGTLADQNLTPDPLDLGSTGWDWVDDREWWYRTTFTVESTWGGVRLRLNGAMDLADVYVNGVKVGSTDGIYDEELFDLDAASLRGRTNVLAIRTRIDPRGVEARPAIRNSVSSWRGLQYRKNIRTVGLWRGVDLIATAGDELILDGRPKVTIGAGLTAESTSATVRVSQSVLNTTSAARPVTVKWSLAGENFTITPITGQKSVTAAPGRTEVAYDITVPYDRLKLWWPNGYGYTLPDGSRYLYKLRAELTEGATVLDAAEVGTIGIRSLSFRRNTSAGADHYDLTYVVNGEPIYMQGGNWVPADPLYRSQTMSRNYRRDLRLAYEAGLRMLRVNGGSAEELPEFYELASRYGIMIMQEFFHGNQTYTVDAALWDDNAGDMVLRLRNYPALASWSGGNELTGAADGNRAQAEAFDFVQQVKKSYDTHDGTRQFFATSPAGGMCHRWGHVHMIGSEGYQDAHGSNTCGFMSELGMASAADPSTMATYEGERLERAYRAMNEVEYLRPNEFGTYRSNADLAAKTQLAQGIAMSYNTGYVKANKWRSSGALVWAYNEMAPMAGWAVVDFEGVPKVSYYQLKRVWQKVAVRADYAKYWFTPGESFTANVDVLNDNRAALTGHSLTTVLATLDGQELARRTQAVDVPANADGGRTRVAQQFTAPDTRGAFVLVMEVKDASGRRVARNDALFTTEPNRSMYTVAAAADPAKLRLSGGSGTYTVTNTGQAAMYGVQIVTRPDEHASDNYFTLLPGESATVKVTGFDGQPGTGPVSVSQIGASAVSSPNLALGKPSYGSVGDYTYNPGLGKHSRRNALYATDGDLAYTSISNYSTYRMPTAGAASLTVDLWKPAQVAQASVLWGEQHGTAYEVQKSADGVTWTTVASVTAGDGGRDTLTFTATSARFWRLAGTRSTGAYDVREFELYAQPTAAPAGTVRPGAVEVEKLVDAHQVIAGTRQRVTGAAYGEGAADRLAANGVGSYIEYHLAVAARTYDVVVGYRKHPAGGRTLLRINTAPLGTAFDTYAAAEESAELNLGSWTFTGASHQARFRFTVTGKNAASSAHDLIIDYIRLVPKDVVAETESLPATVATGATHSTFADADMSGDAGTKLEPAQTGDWVEYTLTAPAVTTPESAIGDITPYRISVGYKAQVSRGVMRVSVNGEVAGEVDCYAPSDTYRRLDLGVRQLPSGPVKVRFEVVGKNPASTGLTLGLDEITLATP
ncbi:beta-galactosidase/beta-glucuronidase [Thermocatellispora tengchongensis]|uniref:beta-mannosidase n=1 Tax=Thermocatellispora tengchongensis TaxID=1073253 RepID=A0A840P455_9ACTN|nr:discoidin domain-containing protein [Thermocatellispora tengchongensis]MBB5134448.1 beta-galactosidase/beta-glucuronidase [Thermocatellispora tengchongensis]